MPTRYAAVRLVVEAQINDLVFEVVQYVASFELNAIPTCSLTLAIGRDVKKAAGGGLLEAGRAQAHQAIFRLKNRDVVEVFLRAEPLSSQGGAPNNWPQGNIPIFRGFITGTGWQRSTGGANFVLHVEHWLSELNYSSAINGASHPGNPAAFTFPAGFAAPSLGAGGNTVVTWLHHLELEGGVNAAMAESDLWEEVLRPWALQVSRQNPLDGRLAGNETPIGNDGAEAVLSGTGNFRIVSRNMGMDLAGPDGLALGNGIARGLEKSMSNNVINTTLWGKLIGEWSPHYWFAVVPRVNDALVVPFVGALGPNMEWAEIRAGDYVQCDLQQGVSQQLAAVGITHPIEWLAGGNANAGFLEADKGGLAAVYPSPVKKKGVIMLKSAPPWLSDPVQAYLYGRAVEGVQPPGPVGHAAAENGVGNERDPDRDPNDNQERFRDVLTRYAQHWYMLEQLSGRIGEISGRLRFDIAPGSQVKVETGKEAFLELDLLSTPFWASVVRTTYLINSEMQRAGTSFTLAHIRNQAENEDPDTAVDIPPFYKTAWRGEALIPQFAPGQ